MPRFPPLLLLYGVSGAAGLAWQVLWVRALTPVFGAGLEAVAAVTATFLAGLAVGGALGDRIGTRVGPLRSYAVLEIAVGLWGVLLPYALGALAGPIVAVLAITGEGTPSTLFRLAVAALLVGPPAVALGATWPAVCAAAAAPAHPARAGRLYGVNALGAAAGALAAGLWLPWAFGLRGASLVLGALNLLVGLVALRLGRLSPASPPAREAAAVSPHLVAIAALTGWAALSLEVTWTRLASPLLAARFAGDAGAFAGVLAAVLAGMGTGSLLVGGRGTTRPLQAVAAVQLVVALAILPLLEPIRGLALPVGGTRVLEGVLPFLPAVALGASFPVLANALLARSASVAALGRLYAVNTAGSVLGSLLTAFVLLPALGAQRTVGLLAAALVLVAGAALLPLSRPRAAGVSAAGVAVAGLALLLPPIAGQRLLLPGETLLAALEGREATTLVAEGTEGERLLVSGGHRIASAAGARIDDHTLRATGPASLARDPQDVLLVGLGTGETARAFLALPGVRRVRVVEIDENQAGLLRWFGTEAILDDPRLEIVAGDGRHHLRVDSGRWDVIAVDAYGPRTASAAFYTTDFYAEARARLAEGGLLFVKFDPLSIPEPRVLAGYLRTLFDAFPYGTLVHVERGLFGLVGAESAAAVRLAGVEVAADPVLSTRLVRGAPLVTDDRPLRVPLATRGHPEVLRPYWAARGRAGRPPWER